MMSESDLSRRLSFPPTNISLFPSFAPPTCIVCSNTQPPSILSAQSSDPNSLLIPPHQYQQQQQEDLFTFCKLCTSHVHKECSLTSGSMNNVLGWICSACESKSQLQSIPSGPSSSSNATLTDASPPITEPISTLSSSFQQPSIDESKQQVKAEPTEMRDISPEFNSLTPDQPQQQLAQSQPSQQATVAATSTTAPTAPVAGDGVYEVEAIISERTSKVRGKNVKEYLVKWKNFSEADNTWEPHSNLAHLDLFKQYQKKEKEKEKAPPGSGGGRSKAKVKREQAAALAAASSSNNTTAAMDESEGAELDLIDTTPLIRSASNVDLSSNASATLQSFLTYLEKHHSPESMSSIPLQQDASQLAPVLEAGSNVDWTALHTAIQTCINARIDLHSLASAETYQFLLGSIFTPTMEAASNFRLLHAMAKTITQSEAIQLQKAAISCQLTLQLLSTPNVPRVLIREEYLVALVNFILSLFKHILLPLYDQSSRDKMMQSTGNAAYIQKQEDGGEELIQWKTLETKLRFFVHKASNMLDQFTNFLSIEKVPDELLARLLDTCYALFSMIPVTAAGVDLSSLMQSMQTSASHLVQKVFILGDSITRRNIFDSIITAYRDLNPTRRNLRTYVVHHQAKGSGIKKETSASIAATAAASTNTELATAIGSSVPLPSTSLLASDSAITVSVQLLTALTCQLLQSISIEPLRADSSVSSTSLLDRIRAEATLKELKSLSTSKQAAAANEKDEKGSGGKKKKGKKATDEDEKEEKAASKKKGKGKSAKNKEEPPAEDEEMAPAPDAATATIPLSTCSSDNPMSIFSSALDTPSMRSEFVQTVTTPTTRMQEETKQFLLKWIDRIHPPANAAAATTSSLTPRLSRQLLRNWVEDLLLMLFAPEFPIAESMLLMMVRFMVLGLNQDRFKLSCTPLLALTVIHLKRHSTLAAENPLVIRPKKDLEIDENDSNPFAATASTDGAVSSSKDEVVHCVCGFQTRAEISSLTEGELLEEQGFLMDCDECHTWYHGPCVGFYDQDNPPEHWHCMNCILRLECNKQLEAIAAKRARLAALTAITPPSSATKKGKGKGAKSNVDSESSSNNAMALSGANTALAELESELAPSDATTDLKAGSSVLKQLLVNYLDTNLKRAEDESLLFARQFDLCSWMQAAKDAEDASKRSIPEAKEKTVASLYAISPAFERDLELVQLNFEPPRCRTTAGIISSSSFHSIDGGASSSSDSYSAWVSREMVIRIARQLAAERPGGLLQYVNAIVVALCQRCADTSPKYRATAVGAIADLVRVDPESLKDMRIKKALAQRLEDSSISTREAVVDLIGTHLIGSQTELTAAMDKFKAESQEPQVKQEDEAMGSVARAPTPLNPAAVQALTAKYAIDSDYFRFVLARLSDAGISVRKKVVKILRDLCILQLNNARAVDMCEKLIKCVRDSEESMQSLSVTIIYDLFFDKTANKITQRTQKQGLVKNEPLPSSGLAAAAASSSSSPSAPLVVGNFSSVFCQQTQLIVAVISRLYSSNGAFSYTPEGAEPFVDILLLLLEQENTISRTTAGVSGELTSLSGLKISLLKLSREQRKKQQSRATVAPSTPASRAAGSLAQSFNESSKPTKKRQLSIAEDPNSIRRVCEDMVTVIVAMLVNAGGSSDSSTDTSANAAAASLIPGLPPATRLSCIQALSLFCQVDASFLIPHLLTIQPYVATSKSEKKDPNAAKLPPTPAEQIAVKTDTLCVQLLLDVFREVLSFIGSPAAALLPKSKSDELEAILQSETFKRTFVADLTNILMNSLQPPLIKGAVPTLAMMCTKVLKSDEMCAKACKVFFGTLWISHLTPRNAGPHSTRAAIAIGLLCKHCDLDAYYELVNSKRAVGDKTSFWKEVFAYCNQQTSFKSNAALVKKSAWMLEPANKLPKSIVEPIYRIYKIYLRELQPPPSTNNAPQRADGGSKQGYFLHGLIALFSRMPTLITTSKDVIDLCLSPSATLDLQRQALRALREFLQNEDRRVAKSQRDFRRKEKSKKKKDGTGQDEDENDEDEDEEMESDNMTSPAMSEKGSWVDSTIDTADFLPPMVSMCEKHVYNLALSPSPHVRSEALQFMHVFLRQSVTNPFDAMPTLFAALTDRDPTVQSHATHMVHDLVSKKKELLRNLELRFADGIRLSFQLQTKLFDKTFDPLDRQPKLADEASVQWKVPTDGINLCYALLKKSIASRKNLCRLIAVDLCNVNRIGIFGKNTEVSLAEPSNVASTVANLTSPSSSPQKGMLQPDLQLSRALSNDSAAAGSASPMELAGTPLADSESQEEYPSFIPPVLERSATPAQTPRLSLAAASPSSFSSMSIESIVTSAIPRPADPIAFLAYVASVVTALPFEDDEPMHMCALLSKTINTRGAELQTMIKQTTIALKRLNGEAIDQMEEEEVAQPIELAQPVEDAAAVVAPSMIAAVLPTDKESLLALLSLQCESAMAVTILIRLRQWLQESYELAGLFENWNMSQMSSGAGASGSATSSGGRQAALKLSRKLDLPLSFADLPLDQASVDSNPGASDAAGSSQGANLISPRKVAGSKSTRGKNAAAEATEASAKPEVVSIIPKLLSMQSRVFAHNMDQHAVFLSMKAPARRGHKRAATTGGIENNEDGASVTPVSSGAGHKRRKSAPNVKAKATKRKRRFGATSSSEDEESESDDYSEDAPSPAKGKRVGAAGGGRKSSRKRNKKVETIAEEDEDEAGEEEEEEEEAYEEMEDDEE